MKDIKTKAFFQVLEKEVLNSLLKIFLEFFNIFFLYFLMRFFLKKKEEDFCPSLEKSEKKFLGNTQKR